MAIGLAILLATAPCLFWLLAVLRHDDHEREPWAMVCAAVAVGACVPWAVLQLRPVLEAWCDPVTPVVDAFVVTALGEELCKLFVLLPLLWLREVDEPLDGGVYGAAVGLGFAACENVLFVRFVAAVDGDPVVDPATLALQRVFTATLLHAACSGLAGLLLVRTRFHRKLPGGCGRAIAWLVGGFAAVVVLHGAYDLLLSGSRAREVVALLGVLPAALVLLTVKLRWARRRSPAFHPGRGVARSGAPVAGRRL